MTSKDKFAGQERKAIKIQKRSTWNLNLNPQKKVWYWIIPEWQVKVQLIILANCVQLIIYDKLIESFSSPINKCNKYHSRTMACDGKTFNGD